MIEQEIGNLLAAFGNSEAKAITLALMADGNIYDRYSLHRKILLAQGTRSAWKIHHMGPFSYCEDTLSPIGLVTKETLNPDLSTYGYEITPKGLEALPLVGSLLQFSQDYNTPLYHSFGSTISRSPNKQTFQNLEGEESIFIKRSPITRFRIFYELVTSPKLPIRMIDLAERIGEKDKSILTSHLVLLAENDLIQYDHTEVNQPFSHYRLSPNIPDEEPPVYYKYKTLTQNIFDILKENSDQYLTSEDILNLFQERELQIKPGRQNILGVLAHLTRNGYAQVEKFKYNLQSAIDLNPNQRKRLLRLVEIIDGFQNQDPVIIKEGKQALAKIMADSNLVSAFMARAKEASPHANSQPIEESLNMVLSIINSVDQGITNKEIKDKLEGDYERKLGRISIQSFTRILTKRNLINFTIEGTLTRFFPR